MIAYLRLMWTQSFSLTKILLYSGSTLLLSLLARLIDWEDRQYSKIYIRKQVPDKGMPQIIAIWPAKMSVLLSSTLIEMCKALVGVSRSDHTRVEAIRPTLKYIVCIQAFAMSTAFGLCSEGHSRG